MTLLLEVKGLNVSFLIRGNPLHAVRGINLSLGKGEFLGIVGESGCGKSAAAKAILRLLPSQATHTSGEVLYQNENLFAYSEGQMRKIRGKEIGIVFQDPGTSLNPTQKIGKQIREGYLHHFPHATLLEGKQAALEMLYKVGMDNPREVMEYYPHMLSGGMRQRVMIALALICGPQILIADEPTTALDVTIQSQILDLLKQLQEETGIAIILITHDMRLVAQYCDRVLVMYAGKIVESGTVHELFSNPSHPYTKRLLEALPRLEQPQINPLVSIEGTPPPLTLPLNYCSFCSRCSEAMNICAMAAPEMYRVGGTQWSACFKHDFRDKKDKG